MFKTRFLRTALVAASLAVSLLGCGSASPPADPDGGCRLTLQLDFERALADGAVTQDEVDHPQALLAETITILRKRLDDLRLLDPEIRAEGLDRIRIDLPGFATFRGESLVSNLAAPLTVDATELVLGENAQGLFIRGSIVRIGTEDIRVAGRSGIGTLMALERGARGTKSASHEAGSPALLVSDGVILELIGGRGEFAFLINATPADLVDSGTDLAAERAKLAAWIEAHPTGSWAVYNSLKEGEGGPIPIIAWYESRDDPDDPMPSLERAIPVLRQAAVGHPDWTFTREALAKVYATNDLRGLPVLGFELRSSRAAEFTKFTRFYWGRLLSVALNGRIETMAGIEATLPGAGVISGWFTPAFVSGMAIVLRDRPLRVPLQLIRDER